MKTKTKPTKPTAAVVSDKPELNGNAAVLGSPLQQAWKKKRGFCIVKGCRNKADRGHFCSQHASARSRLKAKGETLEEPVDFDAVVAVAKAKGKKPTKANKPAKAKEPSKAAPKAVKDESKPKAAKAPKVSAAPATAAPSDEGLL